MKAVTSGTTQAGAAPSTPYSALEEWLNSLTHGMGVVFSLVGMTLLLVMASQAPDVWKIVSFAIYGVSMVLLYAASTLYHSAKDPQRKLRYKMFDHCAIYLLIAGTYTPFLLVNMREGVGWTLFAVIWGLAALGIALKVIFRHRFKALQVIIYLLMGWLITFASSELSAALNETGLTLLVAGGITYTVGVIFYLGRAIPFNHAIWHLFVLGGSVCHFLAVYFGVLGFAGAGTA